MPEPIRTMLDDDAVEEALTLALGDVLDHLDAHMPEWRLYYAVGMIRRSMIRACEARGIDPAFSNDVTIHHPHP